MALPDRYERAEQAQAAQNARVCREEADTFAQQCREIGAVLAKYHRSPVTAGISQIAGWVAEAQEPGFDVLGHEETREDAGLEYPGDIAERAMLEGFRGERDAIKASDNLTTFQARRGDSIAWLDTNGARHVDTVSAITPYAVETDQGHSFCRHLVASGFARIFRPAPVNGEG